SSPRSCSATPPPTASHPPSLHDALPIFEVRIVVVVGRTQGRRQHHPCPRDLVWRTDVAPTLDGGLDLAGRGIGVMLGQQDAPKRSEEHTSELQSRFDLVCRLLLEKKNDI